MHKAIQVSPSSPATWSHKLARCPVLQTWTGCQNWKHKGTIVEVPMCSPMSLFPFQWCHTHLKIWEQSLYSMETRDAIGDFQNYLEHKLQARWALRPPLSWSYPQVRAVAFETMLFSSSFNWDLGGIIQRCQTSGYQSSNGCWNPNGRSHCSGGFPILGPPKFQ